MTDVTDRYKHLQWLIYGGVLAAVAALVITLLVAINVAHNRDRDRKKTAIETRLVICAELNKLKAAARTALQRQVDDSEQFLRQHPEGIPGIPPALIRRGITRLNTQIESNADVDCVVFAHNPTAITHKGSASGG